MDAELAALQAELLAVQTRPTIVRIPDRTVIDLLALVASRLSLDLVYSTGAVGNTEVYTLDHLASSVCSIVNMAGGRIAMSAVADRLSVPLAAVSRILPTIGPSIRPLSSTEMVSTQYLDRIRNEAVQCVRETGALEITQLAERFDLPVRIVRETVLSGPLHTGIAVTESSLVTVAYEARRKRLDHVRKVLDRTTGGILGSSRLAEARRAAALDRDRRAGLAVVFGWDKSSHSTEPSDRVLAIPRKLLLESSERVLDEQLVFATTRSTSQRGKILKKKAGSAPDARRDISQEGNTPQESENDDVEIHMPAGSTLVLYPGLLDSISEAVQSVNLLSDDRFVLVDFGALLAEYRLTNGSSDYLNDTEDQSPLMLASIVHRLAVLLPILSQFTPFTRFWIRNSDWRRVLDDCSSSASSIDHLHSAELESMEGVPRELVVLLRRRSEIVQKARHAQLERARAAELQSEIGHSASSGSSAASDGLFTTEDAANRKKRRTEAESIVLPGLFRESLLAMRAGVRLGLVKLAERQVLDNWSRIVEILRVDGLSQAVAARFRAELGAALRAFANAVASASAAVASDASSKSKIAKKRSSRSNDEDTSGDSSGAALETAVSAIEQVLDRAVSLQQYVIPLHGGLDKKKERSGLHAWKKECESHLVAGSEEPVVELCRPELNESDVPAEQDVPTTKQEDKVKPDVPGDEMTSTKSRPLTLEQWRLCHDVAVSANVILRPEWLHSPAEWSAVRSFLRSLSQ